MLLIRDPAEVVASYVRSRESCEPDDIGLLQQQWLMTRWDAAGLDVPVIDSADFLRDPEAYLRWLCDWLGIDFTDRMLPWPAGPRDSDGVWAPHWYDAVLRLDRLRAAPAAGGRSSHRTTPRSPRPAGRRTRRCGSGGCGCSAGCGGQPMLMSSLGSVLGSPLALPWPVSPPTSEHIPAPRQAIRWWTWRHQAPT